MFPAKILVTPPSWEMERRRRGSIRWYPFDSVLQIGANSAGSSASLGAPSVRLSTGAATATPQDRAREMVEKQGAGVDAQIWTGIDGLDYWGRPHHIQCFVVITAGTITPATGFLMSAMFLGAPGSPIANANWGSPAFPIALIRYQRAGAAGTPDEHFDLVTAIGNGTATLVTRLTGVQGPRSSISVGGERAQRWEMFYKPGEYVSALIDGVEGARHTTTLPDPTTNPGGAQSLAGVGVYLRQANLNDNNFTDFHNLLIETYRP